MHDVSPVLAQSWRSGFLESWHRGTAVALDAEGEVVAAYGAVDRPILPRSANKPLQAAAMLRLGLDRLPGFDDEMGAIAASSHSGEPVHLGVVRRVLAAAGLSEDDLGNVADFPFGRRERQAYLRSGRDRSRIAMTCSGKHAAMLATCAVRGEPVQSYLDRHSALQQGIREVVADLAGAPVAATAVDGCGAPMFAISTVGLAQAYRRLVTANPSSSEGRVAAAMRARPDLVAGEGRDATALMQRVPGLLAKDGFAGVYAAATADGGAVAVKLDDGADAPRVPVLVALLARLGIGGLEAYATAPVTGGGVPVGELRAADLSASGTGQAP